MKSKTGKIIIIAVAVILIIAAVLVAVFLIGKEKGYRTISVSELYGNVTVENEGSSYPAYRNMTLSDGYAVTTETNSYTRMLLDDDKYVKLEEKSRAEFESLGKEGSGSTVIRLERGSMTNEITKPLAVDEEYIVNTPNAVLAVRGTFFRVEVETDENGNAVTNVYTYGGTVVCKRILPDGTVVEEEVIIAAGYKTTIKMTSEETIYVVPIADSGNFNTEPIDPDEIPADDLVEMYDASLNGHAMFMSTEEIWAKITEKNIDISGYVSKYDGKAITAYDYPQTDESSASDLSTVASVSSSAAESSDTSEASADSSLTLTTPVSSEVEPVIVTSVSTSAQSSVTVSSNAPVTGSSDEADEIKKTTTTTKAIVVSDSDESEEEREDTKKTTTTAKTIKEEVNTESEQSDEEYEVIITTTTTSAPNFVSSPDIYTGAPSTSQTTTNTSSPFAVPNESEERISFITVEGDPSDIPFEDIWES